MIAHPRVLCCTKTVLLLVKKRREDTMRGKAHEEAYTPIDRNALGTTFYNALRRHGLQYVGMIAVLTPGELIKLAGIGQTGVERIRLYLEQCGLEARPEDMDTNERIRQLYGTTTEFPLSYLAQVTDIVVLKLEMLEDSGIKTLGDLVRTGRIRLREIKHQSKPLFSPDQIEAIRAAISLRGLYLRD